MNPSYLALFALLVPSSAYVLPVDPTATVLAQADSEAYKTLVLQQRESNATVLGGGGGGSLIRGGGSQALSNFTMNVTCLTPPCPDLSLRDKQTRLLNIRNYVLTTLGYGKSPSSSNNQVNPPKVEQGSGNRPPTASAFSGQLQTFYPTCEIPAKVDEDVWNAPGSFHIYFDFVTGVPSSISRNVNANNGSNNNGTNELTGSASNGSVQASSTGRLSLPRNNGRDKTGLSTISAKLRLYKIGMDAQIFHATPSPSEPCNETTVNGDSDAGNEMSGIQNLSVQSNGDSSLVEEKIRVSVYWYRAPVSKHHYKKKLLDTKMVSVRDATWIDFDILNAAVPWLDHKKQNFGLVLQVENEDNDLVDPGKYFINLPCSGNTTERVLNPPVIEICTLNQAQPSAEQLESQQPQSFAPFTMSDSFRYLSQVAQAHEANDAAGRSSYIPVPEWQNDHRVSNETEEQLSQPRNKNPHKHRHRHGSENQTNKPKPSRTPSSSDFKLDEDHPLRQILGSVASDASGRRSSSNHHSRRRQNQPHNRAGHHNHHRQNQGHHTQGDEMVREGDTAGSDEGEERDVIVQKFYINSDSGRSNSVEDSAEPSNRR